MSVTSPGSTEMVRTASRLRDRIVARLTPRDTLPASGAAPYRPFVGNPTCLMLRRFVTSSTSTIA